MITREAPQDQISPEPSTPPRGNGFCLTCHAAGHFVVAKDPDRGDVCDFHERAARRSNRWTAINEPTGGHPVVSTT